MRFLPRLPLWAIPVIAGLAVLIAVFAGLAIWDANRQIEQGEVVASGRADIGGPFTLVNQRGETVTEADFRGRPMLIYFGFTYCPDICPFSLQIMNMALSELEDDDRLWFQPVLISIDPERDSPAQMALYVQSDAFPENLVGLTGTPEQIARAAEAWRVIYRQVPDENGDPDAYTMDHTSIIYLMDESGELHSVYTHGTPPQRLAEGLQDFLETRQRN